MRSLYILSSLFLVILWSSCRNDFESSPSLGNIQFSTDTLFLDTIFTNIGSSTYKFKVYNNTSEDFTIPTISLERGNSSNYRLNVNGEAGKSFENVEIFANDSIFIFVETTTNILEQTTKNEFLYTDRILFDKSGNQQDVDLVTLVKDANFLFPTRDNLTGEKETILLGLDKDDKELRVEGFVLDDDELHFTNEKPYIIYGFAVVSGNKTLTIDAGARIHFHDNSGIIVANKATLIVNGEVSTDPELLENEVIFEGDRLEPGFSDRSGQWSTIWLTNGSTGHKINHATIKNSIVGLLVSSNDGGANPTLQITNSQIYNSSNVGLYASTGNILGENLVINNSGQVSFYGTLGGTYNFNHCTFANYWTSGFRQFPTVLIENNREIDKKVIYSDLIEANFSNCIIYGNEQIELKFNKTDKAAFHYNFKNCFIRFDDVNDKYKNDPLYEFANSDIFEKIIFEGEPDFRNPSKNLLHIGDKSAANGKASVPTSGTDILGRLRSVTNPDIGAYESVVFTDE